MIFRNSQSVKKWCSGRSKTHDFAYTQVVSLDPTPISIAAKFLSIGNIRIIEKRYSGRLKTHDFAYTRVLSLDPAPISSAAKFLYRGRKNLNIS